VVRADCWGLRLYLCVIVLFICEISVCGDERLHGILNIFPCDCDIYLCGPCPW
jgi:hypothetical protein